MTEPFQSLTTMKPFLQEAWRKNSFADLTAIQQHAIPLILQGKDIIAESPTGTGKTLAYLLPLLERTNPEQKDVQAVILAPTRELVMQIHHEIQKYSAGSGITGAAFIGGADLKRQIEKLKNKPQIIAGTPGRILELTKAKKLKMHEVKTIVVDEVDQMIKLELMNTIKAVVKTTLKSRQILFFSATIPERVEKEGRDMMKDPVVIRIAKEDLPESQVEHFYFVCERRDKIDLLRRIVKLHSPKAIAFVNNSGSLNEMAAKLEYKGVSLEVLHGELGKTQRETVIKNFRTGKTPLLLATDIAARGLDIPEITHVIQFDLPETVDQYIHRSGRTGRMGKAGTVISLITQYEEQRLQRFSKELGIPIEKKTLFMDMIVDKKPSRPSPRSAAPAKRGKTSKGRYDR